MVALLFFLAAGLTLSAIAWGAAMLLEPPENALEERLLELQATRRCDGGIVSRRRAGGGFLNSFVYLVSRIGLDDYLSDSEKELAQAGIRRKAALAWFVLGHFLFFGAVTATMLYLQA